MKRIAIRNPLISTSIVKRGPRRQENSAQDDELASLLNEIHAKYSGSLRAFFEDLESDASKKTANDDMQFRKVGFDGTK